MNRVPIEINGQPYKYSIVHYRQLSNKEIEAVFRDAWYLGQIGDYDNFCCCSFSRTRKNETIPEISAVSICYIEDMNRTIVAVGYSFCSIHDQFNKSIGRKIALGRAIKELNRQRNQQ